MSGVKTKICGITRVGDALFCADARVDFIGVVFAPGSKRIVTEQQAQHIAAAIRGSETKLVGVFQDQPNDLIKRIAESAHFDFVQLHGEETDADIAAIGVPAIKAVGRNETKNAAWLLYDAPKAGSGTTFDWTIIPNERTKPIFLAGGINTDNVAEAINAVHPDAIDVSTGVEDAPGIKNHRRIIRLLEQVRQT